MEAARAFFARVGAIRDRQCNRSSAPGSHTHPRDSGTAAQVFAPVGLLLSQSSGTMLVVLGRSGLSCSRKYPPRGAHCTRVAVLVLFTCQTANAYAAQPLHSSGRGRRPFFFRSLASKGDGAPGGAGVLRGTPGSLRGSPARRAKALHRGASGREHVHPVRRHRSRVESDPTRDMFTICSIRVVVSRAALQNAVTTQIGRGWPFGLPSAPIRSCAARWFRFPASRQRLTGALSPDGSPPTADAEGG